jgi:hypothetical protein
VTTLRLHLLASVLICACGLPGLVSAGALRLGLSQELGYDGHIRTEGRSESDAYSESALRIAPSHPAVFLDGKASFGPTFEVSYRKYLDLTQLDAVGFEISGPLALQLEGIGDESDSLRLTAGVKRSTGEVSTANAEQVTSTTIALKALYSRHWGSPRWQSEFGYGYNQRFYDDEGYEDRDSTTHTLSTALLYRLNPATRVGLRTSFAREDFSSDRRLDSDTWDIAGLVRRQITDRITGDLALGHEMVFYDGGETESGVTVRGKLDYQITPRWHCAASLRRELEPSETPGRTGVTTTAGDVRASYRVTPKLTLSAAPGLRNQTGDDEIREATFKVAAKYAFSRCDLTLQTGVTDRDSDRGGYDSYTALDASLRVDVKF